MYISKNFLTAAMTLESKVRSNLHIMSYWSKRELILYILINVENMFFHKDFLSNAISTMVSDHQYDLLSKGQG